MGRCHLCRSELALRNPRVAEECLDPWLHDRRHGPYVSPVSLYEHTFADFMTVMSTAVAYLPLFMPPVAAPGMGSGTEAPAAAAAYTP